MSIPMKKNDPAYWLLEEGLSGKREIKKSTVYNENCYICNDSEFALMGLPLCYPCYLCGAHVPADNSVCDNGHDQLDDPALSTMEDCDKMEIDNESSNTNSHIENAILEELKQKEDQINYLKKLIE